jgi:LysM repeat protein
MAKTIFSILKRQTYSIHKLACVVTFFSLVTGSVIRPLPVLAGEVVVRPGETLAEIAERYGTSVQRLMQLNNLLSPQDLWAGSRIQVPDRTSYGSGAGTTAVKADNGRTAPDKKQGEENKGGGTSSPTTKANTSQPVKANETVSKLGGVSSEVHERCLKASDYSGCVEIQTNGVRSPGNSEEICDTTGSCIARKGDDRLGLPKVVGWKYAVEPDGAVLYFEIYGPEVLTDKGQFKSKYYSIPHKGQKRYVGRKAVYHLYDPGASSTPGRTISYGGGSTTCNSYGTSIQCNTSRPITTYIPGSPGRPAGARSVNVVQVIDCKEKTGAEYENGKNLKGDWVKLTNELPWACKEIETLTVLDMKL